MISLILLKLFTFSQILQGVPKLSHATVYINLTELQKLFKLTGITSLFPHDCNNVCIVLMYLKHIPFYCEKWFF